MLNKELVIQVEVLGTKLLVPNNENTKTIIEMPVPESTKYAYLVLSGATKLN